MSNSNGIQQVIFQQIKERLPAHLSFVDEISDLLEISNDSAYRRIRGEKEISLEETKKICHNLKISFDTFINNTNDVIPFYQVSFDEDKFNLKQYLNTLLDNITLAGNAAEKEMIYVTNDFTVFQLFQIPELATFKLFFWGKTGMGYSGFKDKLFSMDFFKNKEVALLLCDKISELVNHLQKQSESGYKFLYGTKPAGIEGNYTLYYNEILMVDGIVLIRMDNNRICYITTNPMNYIHTTNSGFYDANYIWIKNLIKKSSLISGVSEKDRNRYFLKIKYQIQQ